MNWIDEIKFNSHGLVPVITQDAYTKQVLMLAYADREALNKTAETGKVYYFSRSRQSLWLKGESSGHFQIVKNIAYDCDKDAVLIMVKQIGAACHTGHSTCFYTDAQTGDEIKEAAAVILEELYQTILDRKENPKEGSYTNYLFEKGIDKMLKKVGEESAEVIIASKNQNNEEITLEISDLIYHLSVVMAHCNVTWQDIFTELKKRH